MITSWRTTVPGVAALLIVAWNAWTTKTINVDEVIAALVGVGLVQAKDWNVTGGSRNQ
jgi:hypothetical protein